MNQFESRENGKVVNFSRKYILKESSVVFLNFEA